MAKFDRTLVAVNRQLKALKSSMYEVGIFNREERKMIPRVWSAEQIIKSVSYLKIQNFQDHDIFVRPQGSQGLVFFDDLSLAKINQMKDNGHAPCVVIESSPQNYHGWVRVANELVPEELATCVCKVIAGIYGGDTDSADWRHYGRLAGFTNRKPKHVTEEGKQPFVLLSEGNGKQCDKADELLALGRKESLRREQVKLDRKKRVEEAASNAHGDNGQNPCKYYSSEMAGLLGRYGVNLDASRADWMIVNKMIDKGFSRSQIEEALLISPALDTRRNSIDNYITVTLDNALGKR